MTKSTNQKTANDHPPKTAEPEAAQGRPDSSTSSDQPAANEETHKNPTIEQLVELEKKLALAEAEINQLKDQLLRTMAEAENIRKRIMREKEESQKFAIGNFAKDLIAVADNFDRALKNPLLTDDPAVKNFVEGITMTERQLTAVFEKYQLKKIIPLGEKFDGHQHQAVMDVPSTTQAPGTIVDVFQAGFFLHDRLLWPALVTVARVAGPKQPNSSNPTGEK